MFVCVDIWWCDDIWCRNTLAHLLDEMLKNSNTQPIIMLTAFLVNEIIVVQAVKEGRSKECKR